MTIREKKHLWYKKNSAKLKCLAKEQRIKNREQIQTYRREKRNQRRAQVIQKLGRVCCRCGFSDARALQIDHVNGGGRKESKRLGNGMRLYEEVLNDTSNKYQLLCANCNWIKRAENKEYN